MTRWPRKEGREPTQAQQLFRRMVREWLGVSLILLPLTAVLSLSHGLTLSNLLYDNLQRLSPLPVDPRILIVTIDDYSLQQLGKWPWPRPVHADLLDRLTAAQPRGVLFDVIFSEPDPNPESDQRLAQALCQAGNVYIPLLREGVARFDQPLAEIEPVAPLSQCAKGSGTSMPKRMLTGKYAVSTCAKVRRRNPGRNWRGCSTRPARTRLSPCPARLRRRRRKAGNGAITCVFRSSASQVDFLRCLTSACCVGTCRRNCCVIA